MSCVAGGSRDGPAVGAVYGRRECCSIESTRAGARDGAQDAGPHGKLELMRRVLLLAMAVWPLVAAAPQFRLSDTKGGVHSNSEWAAQKAVLLFFVTTDCPVANSYVPEMNRLRDTYSARGVAVYAVQAETTVADDVVVRYAQEYRYGFPLLLDTRQDLVKL